MINTSSTFVNTFHVNFKGQQYWFVLQELIQNRNITNEMKNDVFDCITAGNDAKSILNEAIDLSKFGAQSAFVWVGDS